MTQMESLTTVLTMPTPDAVWRLRGDLLQQHQKLPPDLAGLLTRFYHFLTELKVKATAREFSHFASLLDIGAVGGVAVQNLLDAQANKENLWQRLLAGGLSEGLMVLAARQYVKAWEGEMASVYQEAGWHLYQALWALSVQTQPQLDAAARRQMIETMLAPVHDTAVSGSIKAVLIARLYQILLVAHLQSPISNL
jgi:hypothetical protein